MDHGRTFIMIRLPLAFTWLPANIYLDPSPVGVSPHTAPSLGPFTCHKSLSPTWWEKDIASMDPKLWWARWTQNFLRGPDEGTKGTWVLCLSPGVHLARLIWGWSWCLMGVQAALSRDPTLPSGLWVLVLRQLCLRYPLFSLPTFPSLALCWHWFFFSPCE